MLPLATISNWAIDVCFHWACIESIYMYMCMCMCTTGSWRSCFSLEVVSSIPAGFTIIYRYFCGFICLSLCQSININPTNMYMYIKNNAWVTVNNVFLSQVRRFGNDFHEWRSHEWKTLPNRLTSDIKALFTVTNVLFYFLHGISCNEHTNPLKPIIDRPFRHCCQGQSFLTDNCDVTTIDLWRHANARYCYCDVIFVDCHCTRKLAQSRSSLVNNSREYLYPATRYSRLSV